MLKRLAVAFCLVVVIAVPSGLISTAAAHGPCGDSCFSTYSGAPGDEVDILGPEAVLVVWNPAPNTMALGVPGSDKDCDTRCAAAKPIYHHDEPAIVLHRSDERELVSFEVPDTEPGEYVIAVYDGGESGLHYTWEIFEVLAGPDSEPDPDGAPSPDKQGPVWPWAAAAFVLGAVAGWTIKRARR